ncbi:hypothetical protein A8L45_20085 [Veronia pacifica]|uniref:Glycoside hydrolase n=2 Tax=Veronia pacifica TaxID=1080227 RepID=A0A1C3EB63_9GAMM|nr:hypothetical protein A8L45_20085 [Veronia pacifica]
MYPTSNGEKTAQLMVYTSRDLKNWTEQGVVFSKRDVKELWAPDVFFHERTGIFYLYYTQSNSFEDVKIGIATSPNPTGPFADQGILIDGIDAHVFEDDDGEIYFYWTRYPAGFLADGPIAVRKLDNDLPTRFVSDEKVVISYTQNWENIWTGTISAILKRNPITEGAFIVKHNDKYYMLYSGGFYGSVNYSLGYAVSDSPTGPFIKNPNNPVLSAYKQHGLSGPGHASVVTDPEGGLSVIYHVKSNGYLVIDGSDRYINVDKLSIDEQGQIYISASLLNRSNM